MITVLGTVFGERYADTAALELPQLAFWLTAEVTRLLRAHPDPGRRAVRCATIARPASPEIQLNLYSRSGTAERREPGVEDQRVLDTISRVAEAHNWNRGHEHRFVRVLWVITGHSAPGLPARVSFRA